MPFIVNCCRAGGEIPLAQTYWTICTLLALRQYTVLIGYLLIYFLLHSNWRSLFGSFRLPKKCVPVIDSAISLIFLKSIITKKYSTACTHILFFLSSHSETFALSHSARFSCLSQRTKKARKVCFSVQVQQVHKGALPKLFQTFCSRSVSVRVGLDWDNL